MMLFTRRSGSRSWPAARRLAASRAAPLHMGMATGDAAPYRPRRSGWQPLARGALVPVSAWIMPVGTGRLLSVAPRCPVQRSAMASRTPVAVFVKPEERAEAISDRKLG